MDLLNHETHELHEITAPNDFKFRLLGTGNCLGRDSSVLPFVCFVVTQISTTC